MKIGRLDKRVQFKRYQNTYNTELGQYENQLIIISTVWADFYPIRSMDYQLLQKYGGRTVYKCLVRYIPEIFLNDFINYGGEMYKIESIIDPDLKHERLEIECTHYEGKEDW